MTPKPLTVKQRIAKGEARAGCPECKWVGDWHDATYYGGRAKVIHDLDNHLEAIHARKPVPR